MDSSEHIGQYAPMGPGIDELLRLMREATLRSVADVIAIDEGVPMPDAEFDEAIFLALLGRVRSVRDLAALPGGVRVYYATRLIELEVGNGGFAQAIENSAEYFGEAIVGYRLLGDEASAELLARAQRAATDEQALAALDDAIDGPPWNGVPWGDAARLRYVRAHRDEFRLR